MKILLTGATGFIGSHVAAELAQAGHDLHALVRPGSDPWRIRELLPFLHIVTGDVLHLPTGLSADVVVHLAWNVEPGQYLAAPHNLDYLCASLHLARSVEYRRLVVAGTCFEYDHDVCPLTETSPTKPQSLYAASKLALGTVLQQFVPNFAWLRFFYQYGPKEDPRRLMPAVIRSLLRGERMALTPGEQIRDFLHVEDVASAVRLVVESNLTGTVNVGSAEAVTVRQIAETIGEITGRSDLLAFGARPYPPGEPMRILADNTRLRQTGWQRRYDLPTGLRQTVVWWQTQPRQP